MAIFRLVAIVAAATDHVATRVFTHSPGVGGDIERRRAVLDAPSALFAIGGQAPMELVESAASIMPPIGAPDPTDGPAQVGQHQFPKPVAIASRGGMVVGGPVAFHASQVTAGGVRVNNAEVDAE